MDLRRRARSFPHLQGFGCRQLLVGFGLLLGNLMNYYVPVERIPCNPKRSALRFPCLGPRHPRRRCLVGLPFSLACSCSSYVSSSSLQLTRWCRRLRLHHLSFRRCRRQPMAYCLNHLGWLTCSRFRYPPSFHGAAFITLIISQRQLILTSLQVANIQNCESNSEVIIAMCLHWEAICLVLLDKIPRLLVAYSFIA